MRSKDAHAKKTKTHKPKMKCAICGGSIDNNHSNCFPVPDYYPCRDFLEDIDASKADSPLLYNDLHVATDSQYNE